MGEGNDKVTTLAGIAADWAKGSDVLQTLVVVAGLAVVGELCMSV